MEFIRIDKTKLNPDELDDLKDCEDIYDSLVWRFEDDLKELGKIINFLKSFGNQISTIYRYMQKYDSVLDRVKRIDDYDNLKEVIDILDNPASTDLGNIRSDLNIDDIEEGMKEMLKHYSMIPTIHN